MAGRNPRRVEPLAAAAGLPSRVVALDDPAGLDAALADVAVVVHLAGPFAETAAPMVEACLRSGAHYLDVAGEFAVLEGLLRYHGEARSRDLMVLPGSAFAVVASDCLAMWVAKRLPDARRLHLGFSRFRLGSRGSYRTALDMLTGEVPVRRGGRLETVPAGRLERAFDFGRGPVVCAAMAWGDVATAHRSTRIPDVTTYLETFPWERIGLLWTRYLAGFRGLARPIAETWLRSLPEGPSRAERDRERMIIVAEAEDRSGNIVRARMTTPQVYDVTADAAVVIASKALTGDLQAGVRTPAQAYGAELLTELGGVEIRDL